jgi:hypothetical protein
MGFICIMIVLVLLDKACFSLKKISFLIWEPRFALPYDPFLWICYYNSDIVLPYAPTLPLGGRGLDIRSRCPCGLCTYGGLKEVGRREIFVVWKIVFHPNSSMLFLVDILFLSIYTQQIERKTNSRNRWEYTAAAINNYAQSVGGTYHPPHH